MKILLYPFSWLYGAITRLRNLFYDIGIFKSRSFEKPFTIGVGNLSAGGAGKSPHIAYLAENLKQKYSVATLSRGYKRKTKGFRIAGSGDDYRTLGDEPAMYLALFGNEIKVSVGEDRVSSIENLIDQVPGIEVVLLDDVYQHRKIKPSLNILITSYTQPFYKDAVLPAGYLREPASGKKRADIIVVSKCPESTVAKEKQEIRRKISPDEQQLLLFSSYRYSELQPVNRNGLSLTQADVVLVTGIADPSPLKNHLEKNHRLLGSLEFPDHHEFTSKDVQRIAEYFNNIASPEKILLTTEKDLTRLNTPALKEALKTLPLYVIRIEVEFSEEERKQLFNLIEKRIHG